MEDLTETTIGHAGNIDIFCLTETESPKLKTLGAKPGFVTKGTLLIICPKCHEHTLLIFMI